MIPVICAMLASACSSPANPNPMLSNMWRDPTYKGAPIHKIVVMTIDSEFNFRRGMDDRMVTALGAQQAEGVPWYSLMSITDMPTHHTIREAVQRSGAGGVLTLRVVTVNLYPRYTPGYVEEVPGPLMVGPFGNVIPTWQGTSRPPAVKVNQVVRIQACLYDASGKLLWTGMTNTVELGSESDLQQAVENGIAKELKRAKLIV